MKKIIRKLGRNAREVFGWQTEGSGLKSLRIKWKIHLQCDYVRNDMRFGLG